MNRTLLLSGLLAAAVLSSPPLPAQAPGEGSPPAPDYTPVTGIAGNLDSIGSDTLNNLMTYWNEAFRELYPSVKIQVEGKGSSTAPPALIQGTAQLGPMSRKMKPTEEDAFEKRFGYKPTAVRVAVDALAVYVHADNPLAGLTLEQLDGIFSATRKSGHPAIETWDELGLDGAWRGKPIRLYGRNSASGTYAYFKDRALFAGDYRATVKEQPGSASVVRAVAADPYGIGYSGVGYRTAGVRTVDLARRSGEPAFSTSAADVLAGKYPLARFLYVYVNKPPDRELDPLVREFLRFVLSRQGQQIVEKDGYMALPIGVLSGELESIAASGS